MLHTSEVSVVDSIFEDNTAADKDGGAIFTERDIKLTGLESSRFARNTAGRNGGAIFYSNNPAELSLSVLAFEGNSAVRGGALYVTFVSCPPRPICPLACSAFPDWVHRTACAATTQRCRALMMQHG